MFLIFPEMELFSHKIRNFLIFQEELPKPEKQTETALKKISCLL